jgi:hypothetical protein
VESRFSFSSDAVERNIVGLAGVIEYYDVLFVLVNRHGLDDAVKILSLV